MHDFASQLRDNALPLDSECPVVAFQDSWYIDSADARGAAEEQSKFFRSVDTFKIVDDANLFSARRTKDDFDVLVSQAVGRLPKSYCPSATVILEAAFFLLEQGLLNIPDVGSMNVKFWIVPNELFK